MTPLSRVRSARQRKAGYALLTLMFFAALVLIAALMAAPSILTQGRREREAEMIWRGKQYVRGIRMYYQKTGRFPQSLEDLTKPKTGSLRFMRQAYKDPMNPVDGSWRLIYVGPSGQLINSNKQKPSNLPGSGQGQNSASGIPGMTSAASMAAADAAGSQGGPGASPPTCGSKDSSSRPMGNDIIGGNIIGVGSTINRASIRVYEDGRNYCQWEFVWDPSKDAQGVGQPGLQTGAPVGSPIGSPVTPSPGSGLPGTGQNLGNPPQQNPPLYTPPPQN
jgi:type II secretory pathway pseudopilin PulG